MQKLGQHFLKNKPALKLIVKALELKPGETVIEIGPGHGELTEEIRRESGGGRIIAIEKDERLAKELQKKREGEKNLEIVHGDALKFLKSFPAPFSLLPTPFKLVGNIPYCITGHLLRTISELEQKPERCVFTIQKEVAERIVAKPPRMNRLAASVQFWAEPKILKILPAKDFIPPPKVDSAIVRFNTLYPIPNTPDPKKYYAAVRAIFAQPRKTILNNLSSVILITAKNPDCRQERIPRQVRDDIIKELEKIGVKPNARPQDLNMGDIIALATALF